MNLRSAFNPGAETAERVDVQTSSRPAVEAAKRPALPLQATAKSKHPDFHKITLYVRKNTRTAAERKNEDHGEGDLSDLVERLLQEYVSRPGA